MPLIGSLRQHVLMRNSQARKWNDEEFHSKKTANLFAREIFYLDTVAIFSETS
jgi:hypothetical protein